MKKITWVVVADSARARIFVMGQRRGSLDEVQTLTNPEARLNEQELVSDVPGRSFDRNGPGRHGVEPPTTHKQQVAGRFAGQVADVLDEACRTGSVASLCLVAAPAFLGLLRVHLKESTRDIVIAEVDKDLTLQSPDAILKRVSEHVGLS